MRALARKALGILAQAHQSGDDTAALAAIREARPTLQALTRADPAGGAELELYLTALDRSQRFLRDLASLGLDERRVRLAERQGEQVAGILKATLASVVGLVRQALEAGQLDAERLRVIEAEEAPQIARRELLAAVEEQK